MATLEKILSPEEMEKSRGFRWECGRNSFILARGALRDILARYLNQAPARLVFRYGLYGKPALAGSELCFNVSHASGLALYAIRRAGEVGIDVERVNPEIGKELATRLFPPGGHAAVPSRSFFQTWTRMEASAKACGLGLPTVFPTLEPSSCATYPQRGWWLHDFIPRKGYVATVAAPSGAYRLRHFEWRFTYRTGRCLAAQGDPFDEVNNDSIRGDYRAW